jgi:putative addiction module component (TIGR02574 family)
MTTALKKQAGALIAKLKPGQRIELADCLYRSVSGGHPADQDLDRAWEKEIDRRLDELESGKVKTIPAAKVHAQVRRKLNEIKARRVSARCAA